MDARAQSQALGRARSIHGQDLYAIALREFTDEAFDRRAGLLMRGENGRYRRRSRASSFR
jgi:hypothetical protein